MTDESYMSLALDLAKRRKGFTSPNPTVGCVIVKNGKIVGLGYHEGAGKPHAEIVALKRAGKEAKGATLYVTLEPCTHFGRTPPCTNAIIEAGIKRVVIATLDRNPLVSGKGVQRLRDAGIEVKVGVCEKEAQRLNEDFFRYILGRPFITLKFAQTLDGKLADSKGNSKWISSLLSRKYAHKLRQEADAVLVGINTVIKDDPLLTVRHFPSSKQPLRVVIDPSLKVPLNAKVVRDKTSKTLIFYAHGSGKKEEALKSMGVETVKLSEVSVKSVVEHLHKREVMHILVEGGPKTIEGFLREGLWDRIVLFQAPKLMGEGLSLQSIGVEGIEASIRLRIRREIPLGDDRCFELVPSNS